MAKISENLIPDINADWGHDELSGAPYSGEAVQEFIKRTLKQKYGYFHYDEIGNRYMVFADEDSYKLYTSDKESNKDLLLTVFDAPFNYSARIELVSDAYNAVLLGSTGNTLSFKFFLENKNGDSTGENADCTITFTNAGVKKTLNQIYTSAQGREGVSIDLTDYLSEGTNNITVVIKGQDNLAATTVSVIYQVINLQLSDVFDLSKVYNVGDTIAIPVTVGGYGSKTLEWYLDGELVEFDAAVDQINSPITITNTKTISLENVAPGVHSVQVRVYTIVEGKQFYSQTLFRNFFVKGGSETLIGVAAELPVGINPINNSVLTQLYGLIQYVPYNLRYAIYNPANASSNDVSVYLDKTLYTTTNAINGSESIISLIVNTSGNHIIKVSANGSVYSIESDINTSSIDIYEISANLSLDLRAFGKNNMLADKDQWSYKDITSSFEGFYWNAQSGWVDNALIVNAGATLTINHAPLAINPTTSGKTMEFEFSTRNVISDDSVVLDLTTEDGVGLLITASEVKLTASDNNVVSTKFKSGENNRISFVINKNENDTNACLMLIYVNGVVCGVTNYARAANIRCSKNIVFNSDVDVIIKQLRFYDKALNSDEILNNYILYRDDVSEMLSIYNRNDIYDSFSEIDPEKIVNYLPVMYFTCLEDAKNTVIGGIPTLEARTDADAKDEEIYCSIKYVNAQDPTLNFSIDRSRVRLQGTSSIKYPKKNWRFYTGKKYGTMLDYQGNVIPDGLYSFKHGSIPTDRWCLKTDYAESSSSHNTGTARIWNDLLTKASVTYSNPEKSSYFALQGIREDGSSEYIYSYYDKNNEKLDDASVVAQNFVTFTYIATTRQNVIDAGLISKATPVSELPNDSENGFKSDLFVMLPDKNGVVGELALMTNAQKAAKESGYNYDVRTCIDGFPIVVFYRLTENDPWIFLGKHNFNNDKSSENVFGFCDIPGFDDKIIPGSQTEDNPEGYTYGDKMQCWELLNNNDALGFFTTTEGFYDTVLDDGKQIFRWEQAFEARYPDDGSKAPTADLKKFADWMSTVSQENFEEEKWDHMDVYKMAAYYIYLMRFGAADQVVKNSMFTSEDGQHFYFINYDNDTILGVKNDGRLVFDPTIDRQTPDPDFPDAFAYAGHESRMWNLLEADREFMDIVKAVDSALGSAGMTYESMIDMYENKQTKQWCERIYNRDAQLKYINPYNTGVYNEGLFSLQGTRNSHRRWWLSQRFNIYDAKFITGSFKTQNIFFKLNGAPIHSYFEITSGKNLPYGYEITNGASEVTDFIPVNEIYRFVIPQGVSVGDPVLIYGATNIKKLDLSNVVPYLSQISLSGAYSESVGSLLEELDFHGNNVASNVTISGLDNLVALKTMNVRGIKGIKELNLPNSLNLKTLLAKDTGLSAVNLAPGCLIETLELPNDVQTLNLIDLPLLTKDGLIIEGGWKKVSDIYISKCPNLTSNFDMIWNWYNNTKRIEVRNLELYGVDWTGVNIDQLIELKKNTNAIIKGKIGLQKVTDKTKLLELESLFDGDPIYNKESDLYIYSINQMFVFGPENGVILEGDSFTLRTIVFSETPGQMSFTAVNSRSGFTLDRSTGAITTVETGEFDTDITIDAYFRAENGLYNDQCVVTIKKRQYPENIKIEGRNRISEEQQIYTWSSTTENITGIYDVVWTLSGNIVDDGYARIDTSNNQCKIIRLKVPETLVDGILKIQLVKRSTNTTAIETSMNVSVVNQNIVILYDDNPEVMDILYYNGLANDSKYMLRSEAEAVTSNDLFKNGSSIFYKSNIKHFNEFEAFTGVTTIKSKLFENCEQLTELTLPVSITEIGEGVIDYTKIKYIFIPMNINNLNYKAFQYAKELETVDIDISVGKYHSTNGCVYTGSYNETLYIFPAGKTVYEMPEQTTGVYNNDGWVFVSADKLERFVVNDKAKINSDLFMYGFDKLSEIEVGEGNLSLGSYNGCLYNNNFTELLYWPANKPYDKSELHEKTIAFGDRAFIYHNTLRTLDIPTSVKTFKKSVFEKCKFNSIVVPEHITRIGNRCFYSCMNLTSVEINTAYLGTAMFDGCFSLKNVTFNSKPTLLPEGMFNWCYSLSSIIIPESVTQIGKICFQYCTSLKDITCLPIEAPTLGSDVFGGKPEHYVGSTVIGDKYLRIPSNSTGYNTGDWKTILKDSVGFIVTEIG